MTNVAATATGGADDNYGVANYNSSSPTMTDVTATATGGDVINYGVLNDSSSSTIRNSSITGTTASIFNAGTDPSADVAYTMLQGGAVSGGGFTCLGAYDENLDILPALCAFIIIL